MLSIYTYTIPFFKTYMDMVGCLSRLVRYILANLTDSDYPFGIFKLFLSNINIHI